MRDIVFEDSDFRVVRTVTRVPRAPTLGDLEVSDTRVFMRFSDDFGVDYWVAVAHIDRADNLMTLGSGVQFIGKLINRLLRNSVET